jgi:hypothetical protein
MTAEELRVLKEPLVQELVVEVQAGLKDPVLGLKLEVQELKDSPVWEALV